VVSTGRNFFVSHNSEYCKVLSQQSIPLTLYVFAFYTFTDSWATMPPKNHKFSVGRYMKLEKEEQDHVLKEKLTCIHKI